MTKETVTSGMIIKETKVGEGNKIFTILTSDCGKIQASGAGVRSYKSKISSGCSLFCYSDFKLRQGKSRDILNIVSAEKKMDFFDLRYDIEKLALANYIADLANRITVSNGDCGEILRLLLNTVYYIQKNDFDKRIKPVFELRLMAEAGFAPDLTACAKCGSTESLTYFSVDGSCVECSACKSIQNISQGTSEAMNHIISAPMKNLFGFIISDEVTEQLTNIAEQYILHQIGSVPKSLIYLKSL